MQFKKKIKSKRLILGMMGGCKRRERGAIFSTDGIQFCYRNYQKFRFFKDQYIFFLSASLALGLTLFGKF